MKKSPYILSLLCAGMLLQCLLLPVAATTVPVSEPVSAQTVPVESSSNDAPMIPVSIPFGSVCIQNGCRTIEGMTPLGGSERRLETAQAAFSFETQTGTVIYSYNPDTKVSPGTLAKIVVALITIENCELDEEVTVKDGIQSRVPMSAQVMKPNLKSGEKLSVRDLLHAVLLTSANDATVALAEHVSGTTQSFVEIMNNRVKQMGCTSTEFGNVSGLDTATSYTTARDMTRIVMTATENPTFAELFGTRKYEVQPTNLVEEKRSLTTGNYMIDESIIPQFLDSRVTGGMASYSEASGANLVVTSEYKNMKVVTVVLGGIRVYAENGWSVKSYGNFNEMQELMEYTYSNFKVNRILYEGQALEQFSVIDGESDVVGQPHVNYDSVLPIDCNMTNLIFEYTPVGGGLSAPIRADEMIATVAIKYRNSCIAEAEIYALGNVASASDSQVKVHSTAVPKEKDFDGILGFIGVVGVLLVGGFACYIGLNAFRRAKIRAQRRRRRANRRRSY